MNVETMKLRIKVRMKIVTNEDYNTELIQYIRRCTEQLTRRGWGLTPWPSS